MKVLLTGASGLLGRDVHKLFKSKARPCVAFIYCFSL